MQVLTGVGAGNFVRLEGHSRFHLVPLKHTDRVCQIQPM